METIKLHELAKEATRSLRFIDDLTSVATFEGWSDVHCIIVKYMVEEKEHVRKGHDIDFAKRIESQSIFGKESKEQEMVDIDGKLLVLTRKDGFLEIDVTGRRYTPTIFQGDVEVFLKDPVRRNVAYVQEKYPDAYDLLLEELKRRIQIAVAANEKKLTNLSRIIDYIKKIEGKTGDDARADKSDHEAASDAVKQVEPPAGSDATVSKPIAPETPRDAALKQLSGLPEHLKGTVILNASKLSMTREEFDEQQKKNAAALAKLGQVNSETLHRHTTI